MTKLIMRVVSLACAVLLLFFAFPSVANASSGETEWRKAVPKKDALGNTISITCNQEGTNCRKAVPQVPEEH